MEYIVPVHPAAFTVNPVLPAQKSADAVQNNLQPYQVIQATVAEKGDGQVLLEMGGQRLWAQSKADVQSGQTLNLQVLSTEPRLQLQVVPPGMGKHLLRLLHLFDHKSEIGARLQQIATSLPEPTQTHQKIQQLAQNFLGQRTITPTGAQMQQAAEPLMETLKSLQATTPGLRQSLANMLQQLPSSPAQTEAVAQTQTATPQLPASTQTLITQIFSNLATVLQSPGQPASQDINQQLELIFRPLLQPQISTPELDALHARLQTLAAQNPQASAPVLSTAQISPDTAIQPLLATLIQSMSNSVAALQQKMPAPPASELALLKQILGLKNPQVRQSLANMLQQLPSSPAQTEAAAQTQTATPQLPASAQTLITQIFSNLATVLQSPGQPASQDINQQLELIFRPLLQPQISTPELDALHARLQTLAAQNPQASAPVLSTAQISPDTAIQPLLATLIQSMSNSVAALQQKMPAPPAPELALLKQILGLKNPQVRQSLANMLQQLPSSPAQTEAAAQTQTATPQLPASTQTLITQIFSNLATVLQSPGQPASQDINQQLELIFRPLLQPQISTPELDALHARLETLAAQNPQASAPALPSTEISPDTAIQPLLATLVQAMSNSVAALQQKMSTPPPRELALLAQVLGLNFEGHLLNNKIEDARSSLKGMLLQIQLQEDAPAQARENSAKLVQQIELFQLCRARLAQEGILFLPLPFDFLDQGYVLIQEHQHEASGDAQTPQKQLNVSVNITLEHLGPLNINMLFEHRHLYVRINCSRPETMLMLEDSRPELSEILQPFGLQRLNIDTGAKDPAVALMEKFKPDTGVLDARV